MIISGTTLEGMYYDGESPIARTAVLVFGDNEVSLTSGDSTSNSALNEVRVSPRTGHADRFITLSDGGQFQCADQPLLDRLPQEVRSEEIAAWLENRIVVAVASTAIMISTLIFGYFYGLPAAAEYIVKRIPVETEVSLGNHVLSWLDDNHWFSASHIEQSQRDSITSGFNKLHEGLSMSSYMRLEFRSSELIGPNAFALPGGTIVITDQMVKTAESADEILAILAHEVGHAEGRHDMRQMLQSSFVALAAATVTADAASLSAAVTGLPVILAQTKYSRDYEREADEFAFDLLKRHDISPKAFASIMERLDRDSAGSKKLSFISTHPVTNERIERARDADVEGGSSKGSIH